MIVVNENMQLVTMWLTADETAVLDNALITMENLYRTGKVSIHLQYLLDKPSYYEITYALRRTSSSMRNDEGEADNDDYRDNEGPRYTLGMPDIDDHKRQLTFCNVNVQENLATKTPLVNGQLTLLDVVNDIFRVYKELESVGHPDFQLKEDTLDIHLEQSKESSLR